MKSLIWIEPFTKCKRWSFKFPNFRKPRLPNGKQAGRQTFGISGGQFGGCGEKFHPQTFRREILMGSAASYSERSSPF
jgi:hypothetical protein